MDVPVGVTQQAFSPDLYQWPTSVQVTAVCFGDPGLCAERTVFVKGVDGITRLHNVRGSRKFGMSWMKDWRFGSRSMGSW